MTESKKLWGGRFKDKSDPGFAEFNNSFRFDRRLFEADVTASIAYAQALETAGILTAEGAGKISDALKTILEKGRADEGYFNDPSAEDVHSFIEARLTELTGDLGRKLHTGRSRNDQVATDLKLYVRDALAALDVLLEDLQRAFIERADQDVDVILPGYTHLQRAQPMMAGQYWLAYCEKLEESVHWLADHVVRDLVYRSFKVETKPSVNDGLYLFLDELRQRKGRLSRFLVQGITRDAVIVVGCVLLKHLNGDLEVRPSFWGKAATAHFFAHL